MKNIYTILLALIFTNNILVAQPGKDGSETVTTTGVIFNRYDKLALSAATGAVSITISNINNLAASAIAGASNNPYAVSPLSDGDLLIIIKMQGATIDITNTASYGNITSYNGTGTFELAVVQSITGNTIYLTRGLLNGYVVSSTERVQVVRMPRLNTLTVNSGANITGQPWGGSYTGGIVAIETQNDAIVNGSISATALGFKGGALENDAAIVGGNGYVSTLSIDGAEKGEGIAGSQLDYDALGGRYGRGAPANGAGGGHAHNGGGGGGANIGVAAAWTGTGLPDNSDPTWAAAWNLEAAGFATSTSSGGGRGGYAYSRQNRNALTVAPGDGLWGGGDSTNVEGFGGRPLTYTVGTTLFMGGGGGAGDANAVSGSAGGDGGGIVYMLTGGNLSGAGSIISDGATASSSTNLHTDALGGGGGGGAILLNVNGSITGVTVSAKGGNGGNQLAGSGNEAEGPGGGGGGGYIGVTGTPGITLSFPGGLNGTTASSGLTEFIPNGATRGNGGTTQNNLVYTPAPVYSTLLDFSLLSFKSEMTALKETIIKWSVTNENLDNYEVEKSDDERTWIFIGSRNADKGSPVIKEYAINSGFIKTNTYLRLKMVSNEGKVSYSRTIMVKGSVTGDPYIVNTGSQLRIENIPGNARVISIYSNTGQLCFRTHVDKQRAVILSNPNVHNGIYYIHLESDKERKVMKLVL